MIPTLSLDMDPSVISVSLDQQQATLYPRGSLKLTARVHSKNGASRDVKWVSSDPAAVHVTDDGTVAVHKDAAAGTYKVTAVSQFDESKQADSEITVDNREHTVSITREDTKNSKCRDRSILEQRGRRRYIECVSGGGQAKEQQIPRSDSRPRLVLRYI